MSKRFFPYGKKAVGIDDFLPLLLTIFIFVFASFFFLIDSSIEEKETETGMENIKEKINAQDNLLLFLRQESVSEEIIQDYYEDDFSKTHQSAKEFFDPLYFISGSNSWRTWRIMITEMPQSDILYDQRGSTGTNKGGLSRTVLADTFLPLPEDEKYLLIELFKEGRGSAIEP